MALVGGWALALSACDSGESAESESVAHLGDISVTIRDSDQPFGYLPSVIALSAFGDGAAKALEDLDFDRNRRLWDNGFRDEMSRAGFDDVALIVLASATAVAAHVRDFLSDEQAERLRRYVDAILVGRLGFPPAGSGIARPSIVSASMLAEVASNLDYRVSEVAAFLRDVQGRLSESSVQCTPQAWSSPAGWIAGERALSALDLGCTPAQLRRSWDRVVSDLERSDVTDGVTSDDVATLRIVVAVSTLKRDAFGPADLERVQRVIDEFLAHPSSDGYDWIYFYKLFTELPSHPYEVERTPASDAILLHAASHGAVPEVVIER